MIKNENISGLLLIYLGVAFLVVFRCFVHPTNYTTPDSLAYLEQARYIKSSSFLAIKGDFTTWPVGYSLLIAIVSSVSFTSVLVASKVVNLLLLGGCFYFLYKWFGEKSWFIALSFCGFTPLEIVSQTWSETMFLFFIFFLLYVFNQEKNRGSMQSFFLTVMSLYGVFLSKYVGVLLFLVVFVLLIVRIRTQEMKKLYGYLFGFGTAGVLVAIYLLHNYFIDGYLTGESRFVGGELSFLETTIIILKGLVNELFIARKNYGLQLDFLFLGLLLFQGMVGFVLFRNRGFVSGRIKENTMILSLLSTGLIYVFGLVILRYFIPLYDFDYRLLSPFSILGLVGLMGFYTTQEEWFNKTNIYVVLFYLVCFLVNFPKEYIIEKLNVF